MNGNDVDRRLETWLDDSAPGGVPNGLIDAINRVTRLERPKRQWHALLTERPMRDRGRTTFGSPPIRAIGALTVVAILAAIAIGAIAAGSRILPTPAPPAVDKVNG